MNVSSLTRFKIDTFDPMGATFARPWYIQEAELDDDALRKFTSALSPRGTTFVRSLRQKDPRRAGWSFPHRRQEETLNRAF